MRADGVTTSEMDTTSGQPEAVLALREVRVGAGDLLGDGENGAAIVDWTSLRGTAALSSLALGVCEEALRLTAEYTKTRVQFERPLGAFQAVQQRLADMFIDVNGARWVTDPLALQTRDDGFGRRNAVLDVSI